MIVYLSDKRGFQADVLAGRIEEKIEQIYRMRRGHGVGPAERVSWRNSLGFMDRVLADVEIPSDAGIAVEYVIPSSPNRIDVVITGTDCDRHKVAVIVELKQWSEVFVTQKDGVVETFVGRGRRESQESARFQPWRHVT